MKHAYKSFTLYPDEIFRVQGKDTYFTYQNTGTNTATIKGSNDALTWFDIASINASATVQRVHSYAFLKVVGDTEVKGARGHTESFNTIEYPESELPDADDVAVGTEVFNTTYQVKMRSNGTDWEWLGIGKSTWANKPSVAPLDQIICITDVGENGSLWRGNGTKWVRLHPIKIFSLSTPFSLSGSTSVVTLATATITIPAGLMGANGKLKIYPLWATTNNANVKTLRVLFGGSVCTTMTSQSVSNNSGLIIIRNANSESSQKCSSGLVAGIGASSGSIASITIDTTAATTLVISGQLAVGTDTLTLEDLFVELS